MKKVSVIVPVYKVEKYLNRCVESIVNQTYKNLEIILVDDGSPDNCPQICDEWANKDVRIKVIHKINGDVSSARNAGLDIATGEYIQFVDSDDYVEAGACEILYQNMISNDSDLCVALFRYVGFSLKQPQHKSFSSQDQSEILKELYAQNIFSVIWNKLYKKKLLQNVRFKKGQKYSEDFLFNCEYLKYCQKISYTDKVIYNYIAVAGSSVHSYSPVCFANQCYVIDYIETVLKTRYPNIENFLNYLKSEFLLSAFKGVIMDNCMKRNEKISIIKDYLKSEYYKRNIRYATGIKRKIQLFCLKYKLLNLLKIMYLIKH